MENPWFCLILIFICVIVFQLTLKARIFYNVLNNSGRFVVKFCNITILDCKFCLVKNYIKITTKNHKNQYLPIQFNLKTLEFYNDFKTLLFKKIYFKRVNVYLNFGLKNNSFISSMIVGNVDVISKILACILKTKKSEVIYQSKIYPRFNKNVIKIGFKVKISLSIFDLLWSFIEAVLSKQFFKLKNKGNIYAR